jgi:hypothetical protein
MKTGWREVNRLRTACALLVFLFVASAWAQQPPAAPSIPSTATGSVMGYVDCVETKLPVRFAEILLVPIPTDADLSGVGDQTAVSNPRGPHLQRVLGHTGLDGNFRLDGVPAGDYLAGARMSGYVAPGIPADTKATNDQLERLFASMPIVHVAAGQVASVKLTLRRGAVIAGRVQFADGSPAIGAKVSWERAEANLADVSVRMARWSPLQRAVQTFDYYIDHDRRVVTDDQGRYRIYGLPPGNYIVDTTLVSQLPFAGQVIMSDGSSPGSGVRLDYSFPEMTMVYGPGVFRRSDAKVFEIRGSEQVMNADVKIDPSGLHTLRGRVLAGEDRHVPSQAIVRLQGNGGQDVGRFVVVKEDGSFQIDYLLPGSYMLEVTGASDRVSAAGTTEAPQIQRFYQLAKLAVVVKDQDVVLDALVLTALKPGEKVEYFQ